MSTAWIHRFLGVATAAALVMATFGVILPTSAAAQSGAVGSKTLSFGPAKCGTFGMRAPAAAAYMDVSMYGGSGGVGGAAASAQGYGGSGGLGGEVQAEFQIQGGQIFSAVVGCEGQSAPQGAGVVGTGGAGGTGWSDGGNGGNGMFCATFCGVGVTSGLDGSGGGGGGSTGICIGETCQSQLHEDLHVPSSLLAVAGGGGGGGETMCAGTYGGSGGDGGTGGITSDVSGVGFGPTGANGGEGGSSGASGGAGVPNNLGAYSGHMDGGGAGTTSDPNFGDMAGSGGGGAGLAAGYGGGSGTRNCAAGGGGAGGSSWVNGTAISHSFGTQSAPGNGSIRVTFFMANEPTSTISSPASGGTYQLNQIVETSFNCAEGQGGPGLVFCKDSNGSTTGHGHLDTSSVGVHTYTVTALSKDGQERTASLTYHVVTPPTAIISSPKSGGTYVVGQSVPTAFQCATGTGGPGLASCTDSNGVSGTNAVTECFLGACGVANIGGTGRLDTASPGTYTYTVTAYSTDGYIGTAKIAYTVNQAATTTSVSSSANPSVVGQRVTYTATVAPVAPGAGSPTGTVTFTDGTATVCSKVGLDSSGQATCQATYTSVGSHVIAAAYGGNANFKPSTSPTLTQKVNRAATTTSVSSSANPSVLGQNVTLTATVAVMSPGSGTPTGTVTFADGSTTLGTGTLSQVGGVDQATFSTSKLPIGAQTITASYGGDSNFKGSSGSRTQQVSYRFTLQGPAPHKTTVHGPKVVPISFTLTDAQGNVVTDATATLDVNGQPATTGTGFSRGTNAFTFKGGQYRYRLKVTASDIVNGQVALSIHVSDGTSHPVVLTVVR